MHPCAPILSDTGSQQDCGMSLCGTANLLLLIFFTSLVVSLTQTNQFPTLRFTNWLFLGFFPGAYHGEMHGSQNPEGGVKGWHREGT